MAETGNLVRDFRTRGDSFGHKVAKTARQTADTACGAGNTGMSRAQSLYDFADYVGRTNPYNQPLTALQTLARTLQQPGVDVYVPQGQQEKTLGLAASKHPSVLPLDLLNELVVSAALDVEARWGEGVRLERDAHQVTQKELEKAKHRIKGLDGTDAANARLRADNAAKDEQIDQLEKQIAYLRSISSEEASVA